MKIGLVTGEYPPMEGGVGAFTQELARAIHSAGHEVHIITSRAARTAERKSSISAVSEPDELGFAQLHARIGRWRWPSLDVVADVALRNELDILNIQYQPAAYNMRSAAINFLPWRMKSVTTNVVTFHDLRVPYLFPKAGPLRQHSVNFLARQAHGVIATNAADFQDLQAITGSQVVEIPIGSNIQASSPNHLEIEEVRQQLSLDEDDILLAYFGFLNESKGADTLLEALALLDGHFHLVFVGGKTGASDATNAQFLASIKALADELGLGERIHWTGFLADQRVAAHLHAATAVVLPYKDGVSLRRGTLMAALAHGCPVITTFPQNVDPVLQSGEALWLVPANEPAKLAEAIRVVTGDPELLEDLSARALHLAQSFSWDNIAGRTLSFYQQLLDAKRKS